MMRVSFISSALIAIACSAVAPDGRPGDEQAEAWNEPPPVCEPVPVPCPGGEINGGVTLADDCAVLSDCVVHGQVNLGRRPQRARDIDPARSYSDGYLAGLRRDATKAPTLERVTVHGPDGRVAVYVAPGVSYFAIRDSTIVSHGNGGPTIYLGAESTRGTIEGSTIDARESSREAIAVDASDHNTIRDNQIKGGAIKLYRNCGELAVTRHTTPSDNRIEHNNFAGVLIHIWLSSRDGQRGFCGLDDGLAEWGSAVSNLDWARRNRVHANSGGIVYIGRSASDNEGNDLP